MRALRRRGLLNLALAGAAGALALAVVLTRQAQRDTPFITTLDPAAIAEITVSRTGRAAIRLRRGETGWTVSQPVSAPADPARVKALLDLAVKPHYGAYAARDLDLAQYGLDAPLTTLWLGDLAIAVGRVNPVNRRRYLLVKGTVYLVTDTLPDPFTAGVGAYVDHHLLPRGTQLVGLQLPGLRLRRRPDGRWEAHGEPLESPRARRLQEAWGRALALQVQVLEETVPAHGETVTVALDTGEHLGYAVLARAPQLVLARAGLRYLMPAGSDTELLVLPEDTAQQDP